MLDAVEALSTCVLCYEILRLLKILTTKSADRPVEVVEEGRAVLKGGVEAIVGDKLGVTIDKK